MRARTRARLLYGPMSTQTEWISESISAMSVAQTCSL